MVIIIYLLKIATSIPLAFVANGSETSVYLIDWPALSYECHQIFLFNLKIECVDIINVVFLKKSYKFNIH